MTRGSSAISDVVCTLSEEVIFKLEQDEEPSMTRAKEKSRQNSGLSKESRIGGILRDEVNR